VSIADRSSVPGAAATDLRCSVAARRRGDDLFGTAPPARRFVLLEVPGPWPSDLLQASGLGVDTLTWLRRQLVATGARLLLIRRPGRHPAESSHPRRWALASVGGEMLWGQWHDEEELRAVDLGAALTTLERTPAPAAGRRPVALICTHGRHDLCCALQGREVATEAAADSRLEVWECSHLGGDRFAANLLFLPSGLLFGGLSAANCAPVISAALRGQVVLEHYRGRCGDTPAAQAAQWHLMSAWAESRPDRIVIEPFAVAAGSTRSLAPAGPPDQVRLKAGYEGRSYQVDLTWSFSSAQRLTCQAGSESRVRTFHLVRPPSPL
jgi:hypothetical protein